MRGRENRGVLVSWVENIAHALWGVKVAPPGVTAEKYTLAIGVILIW